MHNTFFLKITSLGRHAAIGLTTTVIAGIGSLAFSVPTTTAEIYQLVGHDGSTLKLRLAKVGYERMQETIDPAMSIDRARENRKKHGRSEKRIQQRMTGQETRNKLTDYRKDHDISE